MATGPGKYSTLLQAAVQELQSNVASAEAAAARLVEALTGVAARQGRVACYGVGREGLAMKGFAMRLFHMGIQASCAATTLYSIRE